MDEYTRYATVRSEVGLMTKLGELAARGLTEEGTDYKLEKWYEETERGWKAPRWRIWVNSNGKES